MEIIIIIILNIKINLLVIRNLNVEIKIDPKLYEDKPMLWIIVIRKIG